MTTLTKDTNPDALAALDSETRAWLRANANRTDFEGWQEDSDSAPWHAVNFPSVPAMKAAARSAGNPFFSPSTMRFFNSKVQGGIRAGGFFITSEFMDDPSETRFTVRWATRRDGRLDFQGLDFQKFGTLQEARAAVTVLQGICAAVSARLEGK